MSDEKDKTLMQKLLAVRKSVDALHKDAENKHFNYAYVSSNGVLSSIREAMNNEGVLLIPAIKTYDPVSEKMKLTIEYTWVNANNPADSLKCMWFAQSEDQHDQGLGKALTYSEKYFILKFFQIPTDKDDVDANGKKKPASKSKPAPAPNLYNTFEGTFTKGKWGEPKQHHAFDVPISYLAWILKETTWTDIKNWITKNMKEHPCYQQLQAEDQKYSFRTALKKYGFNEDGGELPSGSIEK